MNIQPHKLATSKFTFIEIRDSLRKCHRCLNEKNLMSILDCDMDLADEVTDFLFNNRYIKYKSTGEKYYTLTTIGRQFMAASAKHPITRETADRNIEELKVRCREVNNDDRYYFKVKKVYTFGSYNTKKKRISDIDLIIVLTSSTEQTEEEFMEEESHLRTFKSFSEEIYWPQRKTVQFLKNRRSALDIYTVMEDVERIFNKIEGLNMKKLKLVKF